MGWVFNHFKHLDQNDLGHCYCQAKVFRIQNTRIAHTGCVLLCFAVVRAPSVSILRPSFSGMGIPVLKIRRSRDRLIFNMGIPILVRRHLYIETALRFRSRLFIFCRVASVALRKSSWRPFCLGLNVLIRCAVCVPYHAFDMQFKMLITFFVINQCLEIYYILLNEKWYMAIMNMTHSIRAGHSGNDPF